MYHLLVVTHSNRMNDLDKKFVYFVSLLGWVGLQGQLTLAALSQIREKALMKKFKKNK